MKKGYLKKYRKDELELTQSLLETFNSKRHNVLHFFPEFKDSITRPFGNSLDPIIKVPSILPFYENLIVGISPFKDEFSFEKNYGLDVKNVIELVDNNRISVVLNGYPEDYLGLDYLAPIFNEIKPPSIIRFRNGFDLGLSNHKFKKYLDKGKDLFIGKIPKKISKNSYLNDTNDSIDKIERGAVAGYIELNIIKAKNAITQIEKIAKRHPFEAATLINTIFRPFYVDAIYGSLGGQHALLKDNKYEKYITKSEIDKIWFYPEEVGKSLIDKLNINYPENYKVFRESDVEYKDFRKALKALESEVAEISNNKLISEKEAIVKAWEKVNDVTKREKYFKKAIQSIGVLGPASVALVDSSNLIQTVFPALVGMYGIVFEDKIANKANSLLNSGNVMQVFELKEKLKEKY